ncbi:MAG: PD-(D/E)XK nuclease family protein [Leptospiraceae bacterium]|nr:PD-(D/E)XK nuclease family protein [Leptospiraceae bacterium]
MQELIKKATIIIENKIYGAVDQEKQIDRYIQNEINYRYKIDQIYVLYLTRYGGYPSNYSLSNDNRNLLKNRFKEVNFQKDILGWLNSLREKILPSIKSDKQYY